MATSTTEILHTTFGPFGGLGGGSWDDGINTTITKIEIYAGEIIDSFRIEYEKNGTKFWSEKRGQSSGGDKSLIEFEWPSEYVISISGYHVSYGSGSFRGHILSSLKVTTNKKTYGPFGKEKGNTFSIQGGKVVGLHGKSGTYVDAIGGHVVPISQIVGHVVPILHTTLGPFGGLGGGLWDDGVNTTIKKIEIFAGEIIDSFRVEYEKDGSSFWSEKRGQSTGGDKSLIELESPSEYVISISGFHVSYGSGSFRGHILSSLKVTTNKKTYGPFGKEKGNAFSIQGGKVVGLHGKSGTYVDAIGGHVVPIVEVVVPPIPIVEPIAHTTLGPYGGLAGGFWDDGVNTTIKKIEIFAGEIIDSFRIEYEKEGNTFWSEKHGQSNGGDKSLIELEWPNEYVISVSGYHISYGSGSFRGHIVSCLKFTTNKKTYGPFGNEKGNAFSIQGGKVVGLHGKSGTYVDSLGGYVIPLPIPSKHEIIEDHEGLEGGEHEIIEAYGGLEGSVWDDGINVGIKTIKIAHDGNIIHSIHTEYENNGNIIWSEKHGESIDGKISLVELDHPQEYITSITGYFRDYIKNNFNGFIIASLLIKTNKRTLGPYGKEQGSPFSIISKSGGKIVGLHGKSSTYIDSIGAYSVPISEN